MREIKFRVWDNKDKKFIPSMYQFVNQTSWSKPPECFIKLGTERFTYSQFTGLKDKDRKEIYEGDILKVFIGSEKCPYINLKIIWDENYFNWSTNAKMAGLYENLSEIADIKDIEVIGNIFENPELL